MAPLHTHRTRMKTKQQQKRNRIKAMLIGIFAVLALLLVILVCTLFRSSDTPATDTNTPGGSADAPTTPATPAVTMPLPQSFLDNNTSSQYIVLYDLTSDKVLYSKNADAPCFPASTTKLLTSLVALKYADQNTVFSVGDEIRLIDPASSVARLRIGQRLDLQTILEAIMLPSGNDAAYTAAANIGRIIAGDQTLSAQAAVDKFCAEMNNTAKALGATGSNFINPDGIHEPNHYTTANDMAKIAQAALNDPLLATVMGEQKVVRSFLSGESGITWENSNFLLNPTSPFYFEGATGMKTGYTNEAGYCLVASAERNGAKLLAVLMNAENANARFEDAVGLFDVCFDSID